MEEKRDLAWHLRELLLKLALFFPGLNRQRSLAQTPVVWRAPTITTIGDLLYTDFRAYGVGAEFSHSLEWVLRPNTNYLVRGINRAGSAQPVYMLVHWDEFP